MPDITMCRSEDCPLRERCYRFTATPDPDWQSYSRFNYVTRVVVKGDGFVRAYSVCDHFIDNAPNNLNQ